MSDLEQAALREEHLGQLTDEPSLEQYIAFKVHVLSNALTRQMDRFLQDNYNLSFSDWRVIAFLGRYGIASVGEIAAHTKTDKGLISRLVTKLVKAKLVSSKPNPKDRRLVVVSNTKKGSELFEVIQPHAVRRQKALITLFEKNERQVLYAALDKLTEFASNEDTAGW